MIEIYEPVGTAPELRHSRLLSAMQTTIDYINEHGEIGLTQTKAFNHKFTLWAAENFDWPEYSAVELLKLNKVLNEDDVLPVLVVHDLLILMKLGRHYKGAFKLTEKAKTLENTPGALFVSLAETYLFEYNHGRTSRFNETAPGNWDIFLNIINVESEGGVSEAALVKIFYGLEKNPDSFDRDYHMHKSFLFTHVLRPLTWIGFLAETLTGTDYLAPRLYSKTPLWRLCLKLDTDNMVQNPTQN